MNCQTFENVINELARDQMMETGVREQAIAHVAECEVCALRLKRERMLTVELRALATKMRSTKASGHLEEELVAAFRNRETWQKISRPAHSRAYLVAAVAAFLVIVFGMVVLRFRSTSPAQNPSSASETAKINIGSPPLTSTVPASPEASPESVPFKHKIEIARGPGRRNIRRSVRPPAQSGDRSSSLASAKPANAPPSSENEVATQFMPLGYVNPLNLQDGGQLVRVELPRSAMVSFGLPVNMDRYGERVKADVLVGADGLARAIRFVQ
jgi:hypothetical protein